jgi:hypothetical protein
MAFDYKNYDIKLPDEWEEITFSEVAEINKRTIR